MWSKSYLLCVILMCILATGEGVAETPEALTRGMFAGQTATLTLGPGDIAPFLQAEGFAPGDTIRLTHNGHGKMRIERIAPGPSLSTALTATDYLSRRQVSRMLAALGLAAEEPVCRLVKDEQLTAVVTPEGAAPSSLLGRRGFKTGDRVTVSNVGERFRIERLPPARRTAVIIPLSGFLYPEMLREMSGAFGFAETASESDDDSLATSSEAPDEAQIQEEIALAQAEFEQVLLEANDGEVVTAVDFRQLRALLPESLPGLERSDASGHQTEMMGADLAMAQGRYEKIDDRETHIEIQIMDLGSLGGLMRQTMVSWLGQSFDNTTEHGYIRTTEYAGHKALEEWDGSRQASSLHLYAAGRFLVSIEGRKVTMDAIRGAADRIDMAKLETLASTPSDGTLPLPEDDVAVSSNGGVSDMETVLEQSGQTGTGEPVDPDTLKSCLPAAAAGFRSVGIDGQQRTMAGMTVTIAGGEYEGDPKGTLSISIMDTVKMDPELRMGVAPWSFMSIDAETDTGYQKTTTFRTYRAYELVDRTTREASISIYPANRFFIDVTGVDVPIETVRQALGQIDLQKLEALAAR